MALLGSCGVSPAAPPRLFGYWVPLRRACFRGARRRVSQRQMGTSRVQRPPQQIGLSVLFRPSCLTMLVISVVASVVLTILLNLIL